MVWDAESAAEYDETLTKAAFAKLLAEHPEIGGQFLFAMLTVVAARLRTMDRKFADSMLMSRQWGPGKVPSPGPYSRPAPAAGPPRGTG